jgi:hypothetical protein
LISRDLNSVAKIMCDDDSSSSSSRDDDDR